MSKKPRNPLAVKTYNLRPARGQALLSFQNRLAAASMPLFDAQVIEAVDHDSVVAAAQPSEWRNKIIQGDCLSACAWMRQNRVAADLVYIDPPFASGANYAKKISLRQNKSPKPIQDNPLGEEIMYADIWQKEDYLNWIYERLLAIREVMSETASIYVHLDWHIGHYVKILMDEVFGEENFRNEIIWRYGKMASSSRSFLRNHDIILFYSKSEDAVFHVQKVKRDKPVRQLKRVVKDGVLVNARDKKGNLIYVDIKDKVVDDCWDEPTDYWDDIPRVMPASREYADYVTQKPERLLRRIIEASSNKGDLVADFFSGSGPTARAAHNLGRRFIVGDIGVNAIQKTRDRLRKAGASFDIMRIRDGVRLFRNPAQTEARLFSLMPGWRKSSDLGLGAFWDGGVAGSDGRFTPVKYTGLHDLLTRRMLDVVLEAAAEMGDEGRDADSAMILYARKAEDVDQAYADRAARRHRRSDVRLRLMSLDELLANRGGVFHPEDSAEVVAKKTAKGWRVRISAFHSPYLKAKLDAFNESRRLGKAAEKAPSALRISARGLELVECAQFCFGAPGGGPWRSDLEDCPRAPEMIRGEYEVGAADFQLKLRSVAGDELVLSLDEILNHRKSGEKG